MISRISHLKVRAQHNQVDALGHAALMLTYTITLILRNSEDSFAQESFPREGYGWFILFIYVFILPGPTIINFCSESRKQTPNLDTLSSADFANPLSADVEDSSVNSTFQQESVAGSGASISMLAKVSRDKLELQSQLERLRMENAALMQGPAPALIAPTDESKTTDASQHTQQQQQQQQQQGQSDSALPAETVEQLSKAMKKLMADDSLSEELREAAKQRVEDSVSDQLETIASRRLEAQRNTTLQALANQGRHNVQLIATMKSSLPGSASVMAREALMEWLGNIRLVSACCQASD